MLVVLDCPPVDALDSWQPHNQDKNHQMIYHAQALLLSLYHCPMRAMDWHALYLLFSIISRHLLLSSQLSY